MQNCINFKKLRQKSFKNFQKISKLVQKPLNQMKNKDFECRAPNGTPTCIKEKSCVFPQNQLSIGQSWLKLVQVGEKWILEPLFSKT